MPLFLDTFDMVYYENLFGIMSCPAAYITLHIKICKCCYHFIITVNATKDDTYLGELIGFDYDQMEQYAQSQGYKKEGY